MQDDSFSTVHDWLEEISFRNSQEQIEFALSFGHSEVFGIYKKAKTLRAFLRLIRRLYWTKIAQFLGVNSQTTDALLYQILTRIEIRLSKKGLPRIWSFRAEKFPNGHEAQKARLDGNLPSLVWTKTSNSISRFLPCSAELVSTTLSDGQGLGNQLWAISVTRVTAIKRGLPFAILGSQHFKGVGTLDLEFGDFIPRHTGIRDCKVCWERNVDEKISDDSGLDSDSVDVDTRISVGTRPINIAGNLQSIKYLDGFDDQIRLWFRPSSLIDLPNEVTVIHFRAGDFRGNAHCLPTEYFQKAIKICLQENSDSKFLILSDQPDFAKEALEVPSRYLFNKEIPFEIDREAPLAPHHFGTNLARDFSLMTSASRIIISNSSLSWWAAFLSLPKKKAIYAPKFWDNYNDRTKGWKPKGLKDSKFTFLD